MPSARFLWYFLSCPLLLCISARLVLLHSSCLNALLSIPFFVSSRSRVQIQHTQHYTPYQQLFGRRPSLQQNPYSERTHTNSNMHFSFATAATLAFASLGSTHLIMKTPVPYGVDSLNNSPLNDAKPGSSGSDYPCKQRAGVYDITKMNHIPVDTPTEMSFEGSASHGGGTCQIAITKDKEPTANSTFKIIQVFEGGCPIASESGGTHPFSFSIPKDFPNGVMTLTWLWYNRIGNREAYQNCAPITVTGGSDSDDYFNSLPNMYLINLPTEECESTYQSMSNAVTIPNPGQFIMKETAGQDMHAATGSGCAAAAAAQLEGVTGYKSSPVIADNGAAYNAPGGSPAAPSAAPSGGASSAPSYGGSSATAGGSSAPSSGGSSAAAGGSSAVAGGSSAYAGASSGAAGASSAPASSAAGMPSSAAASGLVTMSVAPSGAPSSAAAGSAPAYSGSAPVSSAAPAPSSAAAGSARPSMAPSSGAVAPSSAAGSGAPSAAPSYAAPSAVPSGASGGLCSSSGISCSSDGKKFGMCANGEMVWQPVAAGTSCKNGQITRRSEFRNVHVRRHARQAGHYPFL